MVAREQAGRRSSRTGAQTGVATQQPRNRDCGLDTTRIGDEVALRMAEGEAGGDFRTTLLGTDAHDGSSAGFAILPDVGLVGIIDEVDAERPEQRLPSLYAFDTGMCGRIAAVKNTFITPYAVSTLGGSLVVAGGTMGPRIVRVTCRSRFC